jgi:thiamine-monophosphate kinase
VLKAGEFGLIGQIKENFSPLYRKAIGIGDDAAIIENNLLVTTDALVDGVHFLSDKINFEDLGYKSFAVNISDIAAMGGYPLYAFLTLGISKAIQDKQIREFLKGAQKIREKFKFDLLGGDTVSSGTFFISITMIGKPFHKPLTRSGAKAGDFIYMSGKSGDSAIGLEMIKRQMKHPVENKAYFLMRHYLPEPRVTLIQYLVKHFRINSCIDVSDGLLGDLSHIAEMSKTGFSLDADKIPISREEIGAFFSKNESYFKKLAFSGGEDYELLFTSPKKIDEKKVLKETGVFITEIGKITDGNKNIFSQGKKINWKSIKKGFSHF